jgi:hypothetical protein
MIATGDRSLPPAAASFFKSIIIPRFQQVPTPGSARSPLGPGAPHWRRPAIKRCRATPVWLRLSKARTALIEPERATQDLQQERNAGNHVCKYCWMPEIIPLGDFCIAQNSIAISIYLQRLLQVCSGSSFHPTSNRNAVHDIQFLGNEVVCRNSIGEIYVEYKYDDGRQPERQLVAAIEKEEGYGAARGVILNGEAEDRIVSLFDSLKQALVVLKNVLTGLGIAYHWIAR